MDDTQITTVSQLDAALAAQRAARRQKLQRRASGKWFLFSHALLIASAVAFLLAYIEDRHTSSLVGVGIMLVNAIVGYFQMKALRQDAERELRANFPQG